MGEAEVVESPTSQATADPPAGPRREDGLLRLARPRLAERIRLALGRGSVILFAGAGYGKTTILHEAVPAMLAAAAWTTCTPADRDARHLLHRLLSAIATAVPGASEEFRDGLSRLSRPVDPAVVIDELLRELDRLLVDPLVVVVDEAEHLAGEQAALGVVHTLLRRAEGKVRVALSTRRSLGLPLARLRTQGCLDELGFADLALTPEESAAVLRSAIGRPPSDEEVDRVMEVTEGWPLAVAAVALSAGRDNPVGRWEPDVATWSPRQHLHSSEAIRDFLVEEVLAGVDDSRRTALIDSSVPRLLTPAVIAALGLSDGFLDEVRAEGLFLRRVDGTSETFAYHPLFRECLLRCLAAERSQAEIVSLHRSAASVMIEGGWVVDGIEHCVAAGDWERASTALSVHGGKLLGTSPDLVRRWLSLLPTEVGAAPSTRMLSARLALSDGDFDEAIELLRSAVDGLRSADDGVQRWLARYMLAQALTLRGRQEEAVEVVAGGGVPAADEVGFAAVARMYGAHNLAQLGRPDESDRMADEARSLAYDVAVAAIDVVRRYHIDLPAGRLDEAVGYGLDMLAQVEQADPLDMRLSVLAGLAFLHAEQGRLEEALRYWARVESEAQTSLHSFTTIASRAGRSLVLAQTGHISDAEAVLATVETAGWWFDYMREVARATVAAARGARASVLSAAELALSTVSPAGPLYGVLAAADLVPPLMRVGALEQAGKVLAQAQGLLHHTYAGSTGRLLSARLGALAAWLANANGDEHGRDAEVARLFESPDPVTTFVVRREWERLQPLTWSALERGVIEPNAVMPILGRAFPDGLALVPFVDHPHPTVRLASLGPAVGSGHPAATARLEERRADPDRRVAAAAATFADTTLTAAPPRHFTLLGGFSVRRGAWVVEDREFGRPAAARLVRFLLVHGGGTVPEDILFDALWPDLSPAGARRSLQVAVSRVRVALDRPSSEHSIIGSRDGTYRLRLDEADVVDSREFEATAASALAAPTRAGLDHAASLWGGEPLPEERYADWATSWREHLTDRYAAVLGELTAACHGQGDALGAVGAARRLVELDPFSESAHRELMVAFARAGRRGAALRQYLECRRQLVSELGVEVAAATTRLHARIVAGEEV